MPRTLLVLLALLAAGCATPPPAVAPSTHLLADDLFEPPERPIDPEEVFALSEEMRRYLADEQVAHKLRVKGRARGLYEALYSRDMLRLEYDAAMTRNAAQAFAARSGNCLSLAIMTAALARELGLTVRYQAVQAEELWTRASGIYFSSRHVNVTLGRRSADPRFRFEESNLLTIDFAQVGELQVQRAREIGERTVMAMYMNNRAAEILAAGRPGEAYWWAREATLQDPRFAGAFNTLGVIYRRLGHLPQAEAALRHVLAHEPANTHAMNNLVLVYRDLGRGDEADAMQLRLARMQVDPPFQDFERGLVAMKRGDFAAARELFAREADRDPRYHEFQFWLAAAYAGLGDHDRARRHLRSAMETSPTPSAHALYAAKLERISGR